MAPPRSRSSWLFWLVLGVIVLALPLGWFAWLREPLPLAPPPAPIATPEPEAKGPLELSLGEVRGDVKIRRANGEWTDAKQGEALRSSDAVRTGEASHAVLVGGASYEVKLEPGTEVSIDEITDSISRLQLGGGMATATVSGERKHTFEVRAAGSDALARTSSGSFAISNNGAGTVAVGTRAGEVEFQGSGKIVIVRAGQQSIVRPGQGPTEPTPVPKSLLLKVNWPADRVISRKTLVISGQAEPGSLVMVDGKVTRVDAQGVFSSKLLLREGKNPVQVEALGVSGESTKAQREVGVDTRGPATRIDPDLWGTQK